MNKREIVLIAADIRSLHNVGSFFRTADAFGVSKIYLCGITGTPESRSASRITKVSLGAEETIPWEYEEDIKNQISKLKKQGWQIVALEQSEQSTDLSRVKFKNKVALVVGNEVEGLSEDILSKSDMIAEIPMLGQKESLNVSVACGIALYVLRNAK